MSQPIPFDLSYEQAARLLSMASSGGCKCAKEGPKRPEYLALMEMGIARMASYANPHFTHYWLAADRPTVEQLRAWQAGLDAAGQSELERAFALLDEERNNAFLRQNGHPEKQTYRFVARPAEVPAPELETQCGKCGGRFVPQTEATPTLCPTCTPVPEQVLVPEPGEQFSLF
jgi:hypothetical protein